MLNIGAGEMVFILVAALLILGPQRLPELARGIGKFVREFRRQTDEVRNVVEREFYAMDQDFQRAPQVKPPAPAPASVPVASAPAALPAPTEPAVLEGGGIGAPPMPVLPEMMPLDPSLARTQLLEPVSAQPVEPSAAAPATGVTESEGVPHLAPLPGTVARNAPKSE
jgi:sec-independent protein translocase protein TatB